MGASQSNPSCRVVVIGGGYGGIAVVKGLVGKVNLTLIEARERFLHNIAAPRALVKDTAEAVWIPYSNVMSKGATHVRGIATGIDVAAKTVNVSTAGGAEQVVPYDILVIATGSANALFSKAHVDTSASQCVVLLNELRERIASATSVAIVGGGATALEVAGEIASGFPKGSKEVHIIHRGANLLSSREYGEPLPAKFINDVETYVTGTLGVRVHKNSAVDMAALTASLPAGTRSEDSGRVLMTPAGSTEKIAITTADGPISADVVLFCTGGTVNKGAYATSAGLSSVLDAAGRIKVDAYLRVEGQANIFALGDAASTPEAKLAYTAGKKHAPVVVKNILALAASLSPPAKGTPPKLTAHKIDPAGACALALGQKKAMGQIGKTRVPDFIITKIKASDLLLGQSTKDFGYSKPGVFPGAAPLTPAAAKTA